MKPRRVEDRQDHYYWKARKEGYRSRAAFKLKQMNRKFGLIKKDYWVLDLGASPGGWSQVAVELGARVVAVDLSPMDGIDGVYFIQGDLTSPETWDKIREVRGRFDAVICDASPKITGNWDIDHFRSVELVEYAFKIARLFLKRGGNFVVKMFQGEETPRLYSEFKKFFVFKKLHTPPASRKRSSEVYFIGKGFGGKFKPERDEP